jgi:Flp pilus assembly pilin Flp
MSPPDDRSVPWKEETVWRGLEAEGDEGQALIEYALILGLVSIVSFSVLALIGENVNAILVYLQSQVAGMVP